MNIPENADAEYALVESVDVKARRATLSLLESVGAFESEPNGNWNFVSPHLCDMLGVPGSSLLGREWIKMIHPDDLQRTVAEYKQARDGGRSWHHRFRFRRFDGSDIFVQVDANALPSDPEQRGICYLGVVTDVSDLQRVTDIVEESRTALQTLLDVTTEGIWIHRNSRVLAVNQAAATTLGFQSWRDLIGIDAMQLIADEDKPKIRAAGRSTEEALNVATFIKRDGSQIRMSVRGAPTTYAGAPARVVSTVPIDSPHVSLMAAESLQLQIKAIEQSLALPFNRVTMRDGKFYVIGANPAYAAMVGRPLDEVIGSTLDQLLSPVNNIEADVVMQDFVDHGATRPQILHVTYRRPDGTDVPGRVYSVDFVDPVSQTVTWISFIVPL